MSATNDKPIDPFMAYKIADMNIDDVGALFDAIADAEGVIEDSPGGRLKFLRERKGLSLRALADLISPETHFTTIAKLETGKMRMSDEWAEKLSKALDVPPQLIVASPKDPASARKIPQFYLADLKWIDGKLEFGEPHDSQVLNMGGPRTFTIPVHFGTPDAPYEGFVAIDPDDRVIRAHKPYLLMIDGNERPVLSKYVPDPAHFSTWIPFEENAVDKAYVGEANFTVYGRVILVTYTP